ncbi:MAG: serine/threonine-protein kinase [Myxococcota bacterium]
MGAALREVRRVVGRRYELKRLLGSGGMGEVWEARHLFTRRSVAAKLVHASAVRGDPQVAERFFDEAALQASIRHPGVVEVLDAGREPDGTLFLVMELLEGHDLESVLRQGRLRPRELLRVMIRLLDVVAACHARGVVHRDIKPANIFLARSELRPVEVKLLDFGIASGEGGSPSVDVMGTLDFMSPEQARGEVLGPATDIYSAAAVLYRGLTGLSPHPATHLSELMAMFRQRPSLGQVRPDLPADISEVVERGLSPYPDERWATAEDMAQGLALCDHEALGRLSAAPKGGFGQVTASVPPWAKPRMADATQTTRVDPTVVVARPWVSGAGFPCHQPPTRPRGLASGIGSPTLAR